MNCIICNKELTAKQKYHQSPKQKEKDMRRQKEIQEYFPEYTFRRIGEV